MNLIDTHTHIYLRDAFEGTNIEVVKRAINAGVSHMVFPNVDCNTIEPMMQLQQFFPESTSMAIGLHPTEIKDNWKCIYCDKFDSFEDNKTFLENFVDFTRHTKFAHYLGIRYIVSQNNYSHKYVPYLDFSHKWTDEMIYNYFEFTEDEINLIEETNKKFEWTSDWYKKFREYKE